MSVSCIIQGNVAVFTATFTDLATGDPVDPATVAFSYEMLGGSGGPWTTLDYASASAPAIGVVARTGTGVYVIWVDLTALYGVLSWVVQSTGTGQAANEGTLEVPQLSGPS